MKELMFYSIAGIVILILMFVALYSIRTFSNVTTPIIVYNPKPGVSCATMVTSTNAAISCWKD